MKTQYVQKLNTSLDNMKRFLCYDSFLANEATALIALIQEDKEEEWKEEVTQLINKIEKHIRISLVEDSGDEAFLEINAGSGGQDAQLCVDVLWSMYRKWVEKESGTWCIENKVRGTLGLKTLTVRLTMPYIYGLLRAEHGIHRIIRKSPLNMKRHTSFLSVSVYKPDKESVFTIPADEIMVETKKSSGAGGQHVNTTNSAVRLTHIPTGIAAQCQSNRCQHRNREYAMQQLHAKVKSHTEQINAQDKAELDPISGSYQIRSYALDKKYILDHRSGYKSYALKKLFDGHIEEFIYMSLMSLKQHDKR